MCCSEDRLKLPQGTFLHRVHGRSWFTVKCFGEFFVVMKRADYSEEEMIRKTLLFRQVLQHANGESDLSF